MCSKSVIKPNIPHGPDEYLPCLHCLGFYFDKNFCRHRKNCISDSNRTHAQTEAHNLLVRELNIDQNLYPKVFPRMRADSIYLVAKKNTLICTFGSLYLKIHRESTLSMLLQEKIEI